MLALFFYKNKIILLLVFALSMTCLPIPEANGLEADQRAKAFGGNIPSDITEFEYKILPGYCEARKRKGYRSAELERKTELWKKKLGKDFIHIHHYCNALNAMNRVNQGLGDREFLLDYASRNLDYMIEHVSPNFILLPEIYYRKGVILTQLGKGDQAVFYYDKAVSIMKQNKKVKKH